MSTAVCSSVDYPFFDDAPCMYDYVSTAQEAYRIYEPDVVHRRNARIFSDTINFFFKIIGQFLPELH